VAAASTYRLIVISPYCRAAIAKNSKTTKNWGKKINQAPAFHIKKQTPKAAVAASTHRLNVNFQGNNSPVKNSDVEKKMQDHKMHLAD